MKKFTIFLSAFMIFFTFSHGQNLENSGKVKKMAYFQQKIAEARSKLIPLNQTPNRDGDCAPIPYAMGFEDGEAFDKWTVFDLNQDGMTWGITSDIVHSGSKALTYYFADMDGDDWAVTPCFDLAAGEYTFSLYYAVSPMASIMESVESFEIGYGTTADPSGWTNIIYSNNNVVNADWQKALCDVNITTAGQYYFGIHATSPADQLLLAIDDVALNVIGGDLEMSKVMIPFPSCAVGAHEIVSAVIKNTASLPATLTGLSFEKSGNIITETLTPPVSITPGSTFSYTFTATADFTTKDSLRVWLHSSDDTNFDNDTSAWHTTFPIIPLTENDLPFTMGFENDEDMSRVSVWNMNDDGETWNWLTTEGGAYPFQGYNSENCMAAASIYNDADDWLVLSCFDLSAGDYNLKSMIKTFGAMECFSFGYGTSQDPSTWEIVYEGQTDVSDWKELSVNYTIAASGTYYFGIKDQTLSTESSGFFLYVDDMTLSKGHVLLPDIALDLIDAPVSGCTTTDQEPLTVYYRNNGNTTFTTILANYQFDDQPIVQETINVTLPPGKSGEYTFQKTIDMTPFGVFPLRVWMSVPDDVDPSNDEIFKKVSHVEPFDMYYYTTSFEDDEEIAGWQMPNGWEIVKGSAYDGDYYLTSNVEGDAGLYSRCFALEKGYYAIFFNTKAGFSFMGNTWKENFSVGYGPEQNKESMTMLIEKTDVYDPEWTFVEASFYLDEPQTIYIGFFCDVNMLFNIDLFKIAHMIDGITPISAESFVKVYPNPASDKLTIEGDFDNATIFDVTGKLVKTIYADEKTVNTTNLNSGVYIINFRKGEKSYHQKIVIK